MLLPSRKGNILFTAAVQSSADLREEALDEMGLNVERIRQHQTRIKMALNNEVQTTIPILGACTTNNGGIVSWKAMVRFVNASTNASNRKMRQSAFEYWKYHHVVTCIPAAGAASRFLGQLQKFVMELESDAPLLKSAVDHFLSGQPSAPATVRDRLELQVSLANQKVPGEIAEMPEKIRAQKFPEVKNACQELFDALMGFLMDGTSPQKLRETFVQPHRVFSGHELSELETRTHWTVAEAAPKKPQAVTFAAAFREEEAAEPLDVAPEFSGIHWVERIAASDKKGMADGARAGRGPQVFLNMPERNALDAYCAAKVMLAAYGETAKALVPTTLEGDTFLELKLAEQVSLFPCRANVLIAPAQARPLFENTLEASGRSMQFSFNNIFELMPTPFAPGWLKAKGGSAQGQWKVIEQGRDLSTIRFDLDGSPYRDESGRYSPVAAGHGELVHLFGGMAEAFPQAECLHIRNIDNIVGTSAERASELDVPAETFRMVRDALEFLRLQVDVFLESKKGHFPKARIMEGRVYEALRFLASLLGPAFQHEATADCFDAKGDFLGVSDQTLHRVVGNIFHWQSLSDGETPWERWRQTRELLSRPLSVFGVVRKETGDVGGGPVFARLPDGATVKICMEMPHASSDDSREYFGTKGKATHFNPVLVFFELRTHRRQRDETLGEGRLVDFADLFDDRFWLLAKKEIRGKPVCYHETVLYELIGNSATTNLLFVEVPRTLFNPHKTIFDSLGQDRRSYGFDETLKTQ